MADSQAPDHCLNGYSELVVDALPLSILVLDRDLDILYANKEYCATRGIDPADIQHRSLREAFPRHLLNGGGVLRAVDRVLSGEERARLKNVRHICDDKEEKLLNIQVLRSESRRDVALILILEDVTEHAMAGETDRRFEKLAAMEQFTAGIVHEVNNPLSVVLGYAQYLLAELEGITHRDVTEEQFQDLVQSLRIIDHEATRCGKITSDLLQFSHEGEPTVVPTYVDEALRSAAEIANAVAENPQVTVQMDLPPHLPQISGDPNHLVQAFTNVIINAYEAMLEGGTLSIRARPTGRHIEIRFKDTGHGISKRHIHKVFDPFFTTHDVGGGTGLGLTIAYSVIEEHGGTIELDSMAVADTVESARPMPDYGTSVTIRLPCPPADSALEGVASILVVDDEARVRDLIAKVLLRGGYHVEVVASGYEALEKARTEAYDLAVLDVRMPGMGGIPTMKAIKEIAPATQFLFVTGYAIEEELERLLEHEPCRYVSKPFNIHHLLRQVKDTLAETPEAPSSRG